MTNTLLAENELASRYGLENRIAQRLRDRLGASENYSRSEIDKVTSLSKRLFPEGLAVDFRTTEDLRALCTLSQFELRPARKITSHRKFIGPLIVLVKKLTWPFVKIHLQESYAGQQEFNARAVEAIAKLAVARRNDF